MTVVRRLLDAVRTTRHRLDRGATSLEYGLLVAGIVIVVVAGVLLLGGHLDAAFSQTAD
ncbi:hypothetical protein GCM10023340_30230 [Nocardioides marinquilinus]|uniref:Flp family type IVb pilin n=1 Tax=Nocardioides marinquilinus TaxID=1210400 RepID=A0ABP9PSC7_9ACTN